MGRAKINFYDEYTLERIIALFTAITATVCFTIVTFRLGAMGIIQNLLPLIILFPVWIFFITSSTLCFFDPTSASRRTCLRIVYLIQSVQIVVSGIFFKNYFGPYISIGVTNLPYWDLIFDVKVFDFLMAVGVKGNPQETTIKINLCAVFLYFVLTARSHSLPQGNAFD